MAKTRADLVRRALSMLGLIEVGQDPSPEDYALVDGAVYGKLDDLATREVIYVNDPDEIPEGWLEYLAMSLSQSVAPDFQRPADASVISFAESRLRAINTEPYVPSVLQVDYF